MIVVNYWLHKGQGDIDDGYEICLAGVINDSLNLIFDIPLIQDCIDNDTDFSPKEEAIYEIYLDRATISADPIPEPAFAIHHVVEKVVSPHGEWETPLVRH